MASGISFDFQEIKLVTYWQNEAVVDILNKLPLWKSMKQPRSSH